VLHHHYRFYGLRCISNLGSEWEEVMERFSSFFKSSNSPMRLLEQERLKMSNRLAYLQWRVKKTVEDGHPYPDLAFVFRTDRPVVDQIDEWMEKDDW
jgi:hypothetical protein